MDKSDVLKEALAAAQLIAEFRKVSVDDAFRFLAGAEPPVSKTLEAPEPSPNGKERGDYNWRLVHALENEPDDARINQQIEAACRRLLERQEQFSTWHLCTELNIPFDRKNLKMRLGHRLIGKRFREFLEISERRHNNMYMYKAKPKQLGSR